MSYKIINQLIIKFNLNNLFFLLDLSKRVSEAYTYKPDIGIVVVWKGYNFVGTRNVLSLYHSKASEVTPSLG